MGSQTMAGPSRITTGASSGWNAHGVGRRLASWRPLPRGRRAHRSPQATPATPPTSAAVHCEDDATVGDGPLQDAAVRSSRQSKLRDGHDAAAQGSQPGNDLHAGIVVPAGSRDRLERLCRYALRPPVGQDRLQRTPDGKAVLELRRRWTDGTTHLVFDPVELLERLAALTPQPRINLVPYHGVLAPRAAWRRAVVPSREAAAPAGSQACEQCA